MRHINKRVDNFMAVTEYKNGKSKLIYMGIKERINSIFLQVFRSTSQRVLDKKMDTFNNKNVFINEDMAEHYAHVYMAEIASQNVVKGFIIDRIQFIEHVLGPEKISKDTFIDIGDPDGIFIKALGKDGISANISEMGVRNIHRKGIEAIRCDAEQLPFRNKSVDNLLFFQIFEHLPNPIATLHELDRVAAKSVVLSIPYVSKTIIHRYNYCPEWPIFEHHIFEFDCEDFEKIISHTNFTIGCYKIIDVIKPTTLKERLVFLLWEIICLVRKEPEYKNNQHDLFAGCFKKFSIYYLTKRP
jgi:hypothetical protein